MWLRLILIRVRFVVNKVTKVFFLQVVQFSPINITAPLLHTHLHLHVAVTRMTNERGLETFWKSGTTRNKSTST
jgi:hypothetical protein